VVFAILLVLAWINSFFIYFIAVESVSYFVFLIIYRPYSHKLHRIGVFINQLVILAWIGIIVVIKVIEVNQSLKYQFMSGIIIMLITVDIFTLLRIIYQLYCYGPQYKVYR
jgi:hypothetical protein